MGIHGYETWERGINEPSIITHTYREKQGKKTEMLISNNTKQNEQFYRTLHHSAFAPPETP